MLGEFIERLALNAVALGPVKLPCAAGFVLLLFRAGYAGRLHTAALALGVPRPSPHRALAASKSCRQEVRQR